MNISGIVEDISNGISIYKDLSLKGKLLVVGGLVGVSLMGYGVLGDSVEGTYKIEQYGQEKTLEVKDNWFYVNGKRSFVGCSEVIKEDNKISCMASENGLKIVVQSFDIID